MSAGTSTRKGISVEPGFPKIVVMPRLRITSNAASRTVAVRGAALSKACVIGAFDHTPLA